jgi:hypothetical protein
MRGKGTVETSFSAVGSLFAQHVACYAGNSVENRGQDAGRDAVWPMTELQELLDEWIVALWQNRPHDGLRHPLMPGRALTPNEAYAALVEVAGYAPVPLSEDDYIELLPATWPAVNSYGIKIGHRRYDCRAVNPYRRQRAGVTAKKGLWQVHRDLYDVSRVWVRNHYSIDGPSRGLEWARRGRLAGVQGRAQVLVIDIDLIDDLLDVGTADDAPVLRDRCGRS